MTDDPIYSPDPLEESRMLAIRDNAANRVAEMARSRVKVGRQFIRFDDTELQWIEEDERWGGSIPLLDPQEYWAMIRGLNRDLQNARRELRRAIAHSPGV